jgi:hypothetical protein
MSTFAQRATRLAVAASMAAGALAVASFAGPATPAYATSGVGGQLTRVEALNRAQYWVDQNVVYGTVFDSNHNPISTRNAPDPSGRPYRTDCSGLVSMAWHLSSSLTTSDFHTWTGATRLTSADQLLPGDAVLFPDHIELFAAWKNDANHSLGAWSYSLNGPHDEDWAKGPYANSHGQQGMLTWSQMTLNIRLRYNNIGNSPGDVYLVPNNATNGISWGATNLVDGGSSFASVATGDLNNDGRADLAGLTGNGNVYFTPNNATNNISWGRTTLVDGGTGFTHVAVGDLNNDGKNDLVGLTADGNVYLVPNNATNGISWGATTLVDGGSGFRDIAVADLNNDGKKDLIGLGVNGNVYLIPNNAANGISWGATTLVDAGTGFSRIAAGDLNNDGKRDLVGLSADGNVYFTPNNATNDVSWGATTLVDSGTAFTNIAVGDLNNSGTNDLVGLA